MNESATLRVVLEVGARRAFASAIDYPGWSRGGKSAEAAIEALLGYRNRYEVIATLAGDVVDERADVTVIENLPGNATTDFGAPAMISTVEKADLSDEHVARLERLHAACRTRFDEVAATAPAELRKGPRGGGRDTAAIVRHVDEAAAAYRRKKDWPRAYAIRRAAWHLTDHLWEIEDRST